MAADEFPEEIRAAIERAAAQPVTVRSARRLAGGASMETWAITLDTPTEPYDLVLRRDMAASMNPTSLTRPQEFALLQAVHAAGVKVARPRWCSDGDGRAFFLVDRMPGESVGRRVVRLPELAAAREGLAFELGVELAKIHAVDTATLGFLPRPKGERTHAEQVLAEARAMMDSLARNNPVWEFCHRWLTAHRPAPSGPLTLVHGDYRVGNLLVTPTGLSAVLDWEFSRVGDPIEDLGWPMVRDWRFERDALRVGGIGRPEDLLAGYASAGGRAVDPKALRWWEMVGNLRWAVVCHAQAERHLSGQDRSVEFASLGRKAAEMEWELLALIRQWENWT